MMYLVILNLITTLSMVVGSNIWDYETIDDIILTAEQSKFISLYRYSRSKRKALNFRNFPNYRWRLPIQYMLSNDFSAEQKTNIKYALAGWERQTCVRFREVDEKTLMKNETAYLHFTLDNGRPCASAVGMRQQSVPGQIEEQQIFMSEICLNNYGIIIHEIGHALGLYHEHSRGDRDEFVNVIMDNVKKGFEVNFDKIDYSRLNTYNVTYDYSSIMHYQSMAFSINNTALYTIVPKDMTNISLLGQRTVPSFSDKHQVNRIYCDDVCKNKVKPSCKYNGYADPNNCSSCICPDGTGGRYCDELEQSDTACGTSVNQLVATETEQCITSPGYPDHPYPLYMSCSWKIRAGTDCIIQLYFPEKIFMPTFANSACQHYVEIKYKDDLSQTGIRYCAFDEIPAARINDSLTTETNEATVLFRTHFGSTVQSLVGFKLCYKLANSTDKSRKTSAAIPIESTTQTNNSSVMTGNRTDQRLRLLLIFCSVCFCVSLCNYVIMFVCDTALVA